MSTNTKKEKVVTIESRFADGIKAAKTPSKKKTDEAIQALVTRKTDAMTRAYWSGYLCKAQSDDPLFFKRE